MRSLAHALVSSKQLVFSLRNCIGKIRRQFGDVQICIAIHHVSRAIIIEEHAKIVKGALHLGVLPGTARVYGLVHLCGSAVHVGKNVVGAVVIAEARSPDAVAVNVLTVFKAVFGPEIELVLRIRLEFPVHQIA